MTKLEWLNTFISGTAIVISYISFKRDSIKLKIEVRFNWIRSDTKEKITLVTVINTGRRKISYRIVHFLKPNGENCSILDSIDFNYLDEGSIKQHFIFQNKLNEWTGDMWQTSDLMVLITDSTGKNWYSKGETLQQKIKFIFYRLKLRSKRFLYQLNIKVN